MNALDLLKKQHREVESLFKKLEKAKGENKEDLFIEIADQLATHSALEEKIFYPAVLNEETEPKLQEAVEEHLQFKRLLADMLDMDVNDAQFDAKLEVLKEDVEHHVSEEEDELFKKIAREFEKEVLVRLGEEMTALNEILQETEPHEEIPNETDAAPRLDEERS